MNIFTHVQHIMTRDVATVQLSSKPSEARRLLRSRPFHHLPVLDGSVLVGILSASDLAKVSLEAWVADPETVDAWLDETATISGLMTREPVVVRTHCTLREAAGRLSEGAFHALPVVDEHGHLQGILTTTDVVRYVGAA